MRFECPECHTSYHNEHLKLKTGHGDKGIIGCMCGRWLEVEFVHEVLPAEETPKSFWQHIKDYFNPPPPVEVKKVIHARVSASSR